MAIPTQKPKLKTSFKKARTIGPLYTGGPLAITPDGLKLATCVAEEIVLTNTATGVELNRFAGDTESITSLCVTASAKYLIAFTGSLSLRIYDIQSLEPSKKKIQPTRTIARAHEAPVHVCTTDPTSTLLASGSADGVVKVWDIAHGYVTHVFKGHGGVVSALSFNYPQNPGSVSQAGPIRLVTASVDSRIRIFNLTNGASTSAGGGKPEAVLDGHVSVPRGLDVSPDGKWLVSGGRDSVVMLWDLQPMTDSANKLSKKPKSKSTAPPPQLVKTIPVLERVESVGFLFQDPGSCGTTDGLQFYLGGQKGRISVRNASDEAEAYSFGDKVAQAQTEEQEEQRQILDVLYVPEAQTIISVHADQNITLYSLETHAVSKQLIGYNDEIVDATFIRSHSSPSSSTSTDLLALATNSSLIRIYSPESLDGRLLEGHSDIVLALASSADGVYLASGSKDKSARIWAPNTETSDTSSWSYSPIAVCEGHAESIGAIAMSRTKPEPGSKNPLRFMFTGSQDRTIKMWDLSAVSQETFTAGQELRCKSLTTQKAHEKDINSLDVSPNDKLLASGSQDRTAKIYAIDYTPTSGGVKGELRHLGTLKGHKRGVWSVRFCRTNRVIATGSGDKTVKIWSLDDYSCLKTFEGHTNSVLRVDFFNAGMQLITTASDGLVKVWSIHEEECKATLDNHEDKIWALAVSSDDRTIVSGGADSMVTFWEDCTQKTEVEKESQRAALVLKDQEFQNYVSLGDYKRAILLALSLRQPGRLLSLFRTVVSTRSESDSNESESGVKLLDQIIKSLDGTDVVKLLTYVRDWNTQAKTSAIAQTILYAIVKLRSAESVVQSFKDSNVEKRIEAADPDEDPESSKPVTNGETALKEMVEALIPYSERHMSRMDRLLQESYVVDYILGEMDNGMFDADFSDDEDDGMEVDDVQ
ncbi:hypothetical protein D9611_005622 [Ephemerocybe angulata]|uniref:U3 small nucleolar RNA-associated protein 13 C-terminal domain-containing protein n=1 Tax=Ephemerocybe angulata TaxID=980116 RepID=A0A8H5F4X0_9AGAR|nr:hypothetical protein D9611_005622 [Tulosesus angulatus]